MISPLLLQFGYLALYPMVVIEGPMITTFAGFLIFSGYFHFFPAFIVVLLGDMTSDILYYSIGHFSNSSKRIQAYISKQKFLTKNLPLLKDLWDKHPIKTMFFGKQAYVISVPIVISSGILRIGIVRFMLYSIPVSAFQAGFYLGIGYFTGNGYMLATQYMEYPAIAITLIFIGLWFFYRKMRQKLSKNFSIK